MALLMFGPVVVAAPIQYTLEGVGSGTLAGVAFANASFVVQVTGDSEGVEVTNTALATNPVQGSIVIDGVAQAGFVDPLAVYASCSASMSIALARVAGSTYNTVFGGLDIPGYACGLSTSVPTTPVRPASLISASAVGTSAGTLQFTAIQSLKYRAEATMPAGISFAGSSAVLSVTGGDLTPGYISRLRSGAVIELGSDPASPTGALTLYMGGLDLGPGTSLTFRSSTPQPIVIVNTAGPTSVAGRLAVESSNGAAPARVEIQVESGIGIAPTGEISASGGLSIRPKVLPGSGVLAIVNQGVLDGGTALRVDGTTITGGGAFVGDAIVLKASKSANNPVNGAHYLQNGLQLFPAHGSDVLLALNMAGPTPTFVNVRVNGNAIVGMPSAWPLGVDLPPNNAVIPAGGRRPANAPEPSYGGGSLIVQATGSLKLDPWETNDFVFPGAIALKASGTMDLNGVAVNQGWTTSGQQFQGVFFESPQIASSTGAIAVLTNSPNWINFSSRPAASVRAWTLTSSRALGTAFVVADGSATHLNTFSTTVEAAANGECWICLVDSTPVDLR